MTNEDFMTEHGAKALAQTIRKYWFARGFDVHTEVIPVAAQMGKSSLEKVVWVVRSDMLNGQPVRRAKALAA